MKRKTLIILGVILLIIIMAAIAGKMIISNIEQNLNDLTLVNIDEVDLSKLADGTYNGSYKAFPVEAEVNVTVKDNQITGIQLVRHNNGKGGGAEAILSEVVEKDSIMVDAVTGATYSSKVILKAIENALNNAPNE
ncbi:MAG: FMN-binding protein [Firmicutes bacterium HGW-Firmicutes-21]|nr:MAG: FMN-binding protein [Firmicutes bacterium HGW-Firmicutes-21]